MNDSAGTSPSSLETLLLSSASGMRLDVVPIGGAITRLFVPDRDGNPVDVVLGLDDPDAYARRPSFLGALIGRYGNRIRGGEFMLDGVRYQLERNDPPNHLHGGSEGFDVQVWNVQPEHHPEGPSLKLSLSSERGDQGYPGRLTVVVRYILTESNRLLITYEAETDEPTILNLTQHSYFNLAGHASGDILDHHLTIPAGCFTPTDETQIPTGVVQSVEGTALDFRQTRRIGDVIDEEDPHLSIGSGFDHNYVISKEAGTMRHAARAWSTATGIVMDVFTDQPGLQFYSGNHLDGVSGKEGAHYGPRTGFCLETQHFPDSPNQPSFPSTVLRPGERFSSRTEYRFGVME